MLRAVCAAGVSVLHPNNPKQTTPYALQERDTRQQIAQEQLQGWHSFQSLQLLWMEEHYRTALQHIAALHGQRLWLVSSAQRVALNCQVVQKNGELLRVLMQRWGLCRGLKGCEGL